MSTDPNEPKESEEKMSKHIVDVEASESEARRFEEPPASAKPARPGRSSVLTVRLGDDELAALTGLAEARGIPVSTLARSLIVTGTASPNDESVHDSVVRALRETLMPEVLAPDRSPREAS